MAQQNNTVVPTPIPVAAVTPVKNIHLELAQKYAIAKLKRSVILRRLVTKYCCLRRVET